MGDLNARTDSFITLLLDVSGRARSGDLQAMSASEAAEALRQYAAAHPERSLAFDGDSLGPVSSVPTPAPAHVTPAGPDDGMFEFGPAPSAPVVSPAGGVPTETPVPDPFGTASAVVPSGAIQPAAADEVPGQSMPPGIPGTGVPDSQSFEPREIGSPAPADFVDLPPLDGAADASERAPRVPLYWWVLAVLLGWLGGLIGWLILRRENPKGARTVLITGIAVTLLSVVLAVASVMLGLTAFLGFAPVQSAL